VLDESDGDYLVFEHAESELVSEAMGSLDGGDAGWREAVYYHAHALAVAVAV